MIASRPRRELREPSPPTPERTLREPVIQLESLSRRFGQKTALDDVTLLLPRGKVYGLVGANGAGKTTIIRHVLGLLRAESGTVRVFGMDPVAEPVAVLSRVGYLSEENDLPAWMRVGDLIRYTRAFFSAWDDRYAEELSRAFALDASARIRDLSRGQKARAGLIAALAHRPELLVLDEPSSGLDLIVRRDILGAVLRTTAHEGRTVLFSSHLLDEVGRASSCQQSHAQLGAGEDYPWWRYYRSFAVEVAETAIDCWLEFANYRREGGFGES